MGLQVLPVELTEVVQRRAEADGLGDGRGARLELEGQVVEGGVIKADPVDHFTAGLPGRHDAEQGFAAIEHANAGWAKHFVGGQGIEVAVQILDVDRKSTRLNSSHVRISYAVFCLKKKKKQEQKIRV